MFLKGYALPFFLTNDLKGDSYLFQSPLKHIC